MCELKLNPQPKPTWRNAVDWVRWSASLYLHLVLILPLMLTLALTLASPRPCHRLHPRPALTPPSPSPPAPAHHPRPHQVAVVGPPLESSAAAERGRAASPGQPERRAAL